MKTESYRTVTVWFVITCSLFTGNLLFQQKVCTAGNDSTLPKQNLVKLDPNMAAIDPENGTRWYNILDLGLEGQGWRETEHPFDRLPAKAKGVVRNPVWSLSHHSSGLRARFVTDATTISARWSLRFDNLAMNHMPATGVSGLDLYARDGTDWRWVAVGRPTQIPENQATLIGGIPPGSHEFLLYLPLYNGVDSVEIGLPPSAEIAKAPLRPEDRHPPMVFYGTSITHGGCASRPGMTYPAILSRRLRYPFINLGFSGNGRMDPEFGDLLGDLDASVYVIDCLPNMNPEMVTERTSPLVHKIRQLRPETPILLVENIVYQNSWFLPDAKTSYQKKNEALRAAYESLAAEGVRNLYYVKSDDLLGTDGLATVDGTHPTDLGFIRMADALEPILRNALRE